MAEDSSESGIEKAILDVVNFLGKKLEEWENNLEEAIAGNQGIEYFYSKNFKQHSLIPELIKLWIPVFKSLGVKDLQEYGKAINQIKSEGGSEELRGLILELEETEEELSEFLRREVDPVLNERFQGSTAPPLINPGNIQLVDVDTGTTVSLAEKLQAPYNFCVFIRYYGSPQCIRHLEQIQKRLEDINKKKRCLVLLIARGSVEGGRAWKENSGLGTLPLFVDRDGDFVDVFRIPRSVWATCRTGYAKGIVAQILGSGKSVPNMGYPDPVHDFHQAGADIVLTPQGKVVFHKTSLSALDRPTVPEILEAIPSKNQLSKVVISL